MTTPKRATGPSPELLALARTIRQLRRARELSQEALAAAADLHPKHLSEIERANKDPRATTVIRLADALGLSPAELYARCEAAVAERAPTPGRSVQRQPAAGGGGGP